MYHEGTQARIRVYDTSEGKLEKVVMIIGKRNIVLDPAALAIAASVADELKHAIAVAAPGFVATDALAELVRRHVLPYCISKQSDRGPNGSWKIDAIKKYRVITDSGLKEAKDAVEYMEVAGFERWMLKIWVPYRCDYPHLVGCQLSNMETIEQKLKRGY